MTIAVVLNDKGIVSPIVEGTILRIIQPDFTYTDYRNPALDLTEGRRGATLRQAIESGVTTFIAPPATFCELSYKKAKEEQVTFYNVEPNQTYEAIEAALKAGQIKISTDLPAEQVVASAPVAH